MASRLRTVIIGVGNSCNGDDAAGLFAAQRLRGVASDRAMILMETGDMAGLIGAGVLRRACRVQCCTDNGTFIYLPYATYGERRMAASGHA